MGMRYYKHGLKNKSLRIFIVVFIVLCTSYCQSIDTPQPTADLRLWYNQPAQHWNQALPVGNGRLGAMIFGQPQREQLQLNEDTVWAGGPNNNVNPAAADAIEKVSALILTGRYQEAQALADQQIKSTNQGMPYQTVGNLTLDFPGHEHAEHYYRDLNLANAIATVSYTHQDVTFTREIFSSFTDNVIVIRLSASKPGQITTTLGFASPQQHQVTVTNNLLRVEGKASSHEGVEGKIVFTTLVQPQISGGSLHQGEKQLHIEHADEAIIRIAIGTNFTSYRDVSGDSAARAREHLIQASRQPFVMARQTHEKFYRQLFDRVSLELGESTRRQASVLPTDQRIANFSQADDPHLAMLYFQYGRYLLISSSQPGTQPANLQGIWNPHTNPPWDSKYTVNINTEMNYWPAEITQLSELHQPLFDMLADLSITGQESAKKLYGARGWMMHHNTDIWRITGQVDAPFYGQWQTGGAWLSQHLWYHYLFTGDQDFLRKYYPVLRESARFFVDTLVAEPSNNWLVVVPSNSPENTYLRDGIPTSISAGTTMDNQLVFDLFSVVIDAAGILGVDKHFADELKTKRDRLPPMQIGKFGQLQEWLHDWDDPNDHHRHISHLYGLYPGNQISPYRTPELLSAAKVSLLQRGDKSTGWSMGWKINWWARFLDGDRAYELLQEQITLVEDTDEITETGGTYANMLDAHPPFQIDGNFGVTAGIAEMLVQSHDGVIHILPALPAAWPTGNVKGLATRGGFVVDIAWEDGQLTHLRLHAKRGGNARLRVHTRIADSKGQPLAETTGENPNAFFQVPQIKPPLIHNRAMITKPNLRQSWLVDVATKPRQDYVFIPMKNK